MTPINQTLVRLFPSHRDIFLGKTFFMLMGGSTAVNYATRNTRVDWKALRESKQIAGNNSPSPNARSTNKRLVDRRHFFQDIKPFPCIHQSCLKGNLRFFSTRNEWKTHMRRAHSSGWVEYLQLNLLWRCSVCGKASSTEYASRKLMYEALLEHFKARHCMEADHPISRAATNDCVPLFRPIDTCPICGTCYTPGPDQVHVSHQLSTSSTDSKTGSLEDLAREKTEDCIADHLESLAFFFTSRTLSYPMPLASLELIFSDTSQSSCQEQMAPLEFSIHFRDPPLRPSQDCDSDSQCEASDGEEQECVAANEDQVLAEWGNNSWLLNYKTYEFNKFNSIDQPFAGERDKEGNWSPLGSVGALLYATYGLLLLHICSEMVSKTRNVSTNKKLGEGAELFRSLNRLRLAVKQMNSDSKKVGDDGGGFQVRLHFTVFFVCA